MKTEKIDKRLQVLVTENQHDKLRTLAYYTGRTIGDLVREAIDNLDEKKLREIE